MPGGTTPEETIETGAGAGAGPEMGAKITAGLKLFEDNCESCHASTPIQNTSVDGITTAIAGVAVMESLSSLSAEDIEQISAYLSDADTTEGSEGTTEEEMSEEADGEEMGSDDSLADQAIDPEDEGTPPLALDGNALYDMHCLKCHQQSPKKGEPANKTQKAIDDNKGGMGALKGVLTAEQLKAIADAD